MITHLYYTVFHERVRDAERRLKLQLLNITISHLVWT